MRGVDYKKLWRRQLILPALILVLLAGGALVSKSLSGSAQGSIGPDPATQQQTTTPKKPDIKVDGKYISFSYPAILSRVAGDKPAGNVLENFALKTPSPPYWNIDVQVLSLPSGQLTDSTAYSLRLQSPNQYSVGSIVAGGHVYPTFTDNNGGNNVLAFAQNGKLLATVSLTSAGPDDPVMDNAVKTVLASLAWQ